MRILKQIWRQLWFTSEEFEFPSLKREIHDWYTKQVEGEPEIEPLKLPPVKPLAAKLRRVK